MRKYYLLCAFATLSSITTKAQLYLNGADIFVSSAAVVTVQDSIIINNAASNFINEGNVEANDLLVNAGVYTNEVGAITDVRDTAVVLSDLINDSDFRSNKVVITAGGNLQNTGTIQLEKGLRAIPGASFTTNTGAIEFVGNDNDKRLDIGGAIPLLQVRDLTFNAGLATNRIIMESVVEVSNTLSFQSGRVEYDAPGNELIVTQGGIVTMDSVAGNGIMTDELFYYPAAVGDFMRFPVGDASGNFRPFWVKGAQYTSSSPKLGVSYLGASSVPNNDLIGYNANYNQNSWGFREVGSSNFDSSIVQVQFATADGISLGNAVVAEGFIISGNDTLVYSLGNGPNSTLNPLGGIVESLLPAQGNSIVVIGQSTDLKLNIQAILEGGINSGIIMSVDASFRDTLATIFEFDSASPSVSIKPMMKNKTIPVNAIDSIRIFLRNGVSGPLVDSSSAWLMSDGSIRDYVTGEQPYSVFTNAPAGSYFIMLRHRNHLAVQSNAAVPINNVPNAGFDWDFTSPSNIYGGGGYKINGATAIIATGNANGDNEVNASDYFEVGLSSNSLETGYRNTDIQFNNGEGAAVNSTDFTKVQQNSSILYFSTVP